MMVKQHYNFFHYFFIHNALTCRTGSQVAEFAGLIADISQVYLQRDKFIETQEIRVYFSDFFLKAWDH
jgi:hypothetical protein